MEISIDAPAASALGTTPAVTAAGENRISSSSASHRPDLEYLKAVNSVAPPQDPQLLFLLMGQYSNANLQGEGAEFFSARLKEFETRLTDAQRALYLSAIGLLRAQNASSVPLLHRVGYINETIAILEQAKQLSGGAIFVVNWIACRSRPTSRPVSSERGSRGRAALVLGKRRQSPTCGMVAGSLLSPGQAGDGGGRTDQGAGVSAAERL